MTAARIIIDGIVQGVGYRWFAQQAAVDLGLTGWVRNRMNGDVEVLVEGAKHNIDNLIIELKKGPRFSRVEYANVEWRTPTGKYANFTIKH